MTYSIKKILVAIDPSDGSRAALDHALSLARTVFATLDVIHVWEPPRFIRPDLLVWMETDGDPEALATHVDRVVRRELEQFLSEGAWPGIEDVERFVKLGEPAPVIVETAVEGAYDLLVVGTHGRTGVSRLLLGSVAEKIVRTSPVPVMTVHAPAASDALRKAS